MASTSVMKNKRKVVKELVKELVKDQGTWIFADTECKVDKKVTFTWNSLFQSFQDKDFQLLLQDDVSTDPIISLKLSTFYGKFSKVT